MKILIISRTTYPLQSPRAFRTAELSEQLAKMGHQVVVYTIQSKFDYTCYERETKVKVKPIKTLFCTSNSDHSGRYKWWDKILYHCFHKLIEFPDIELFYRLTSVIQHESNVDLLITIAHPHTIHWGTARAKSKLGNKFPKFWVADCGDPYMMSPFVKHKQYLSYFEKKWCRLVDYITVPTHDSKNGYYKEFENKICVIPQGFDFLKTPIAQYVPNKIITFIYTGVFYEGKRDPYAFIDFLATCKFDFKFIIYTTSTLKGNYAGKLGDKLVVIKGKTRKEIIYELSKADFLLNIVNGNTIQTPSKLIDYYISKRPILEISTKFSEQLQFLQFVKRDYSTQKIIANGDQYRIENVANNFLKLVENNDNNK